MSELELLELVGLVVKVKPLYFARNLVKTDVIEACVAGALEIADGPIGDQKPFLPAHEDVLAVHIPVVDVVLLAGVGADGLPAGEPAPVADVVCVGGAPVGAACEEGVLGADDLCLEVGRERGPVGGEALDAQVAAEEGRRHVDVLELDVDVVRGPPRVLRADETRPRPQERRRVRGDAPRDGSERQRARVPVLDGRRRRRQDYRCSWRRSWRVPWQRVGRRRHIVVLKIVLRSRGGVAGRCRQFGDGGQRPWRYRYGIARRVCGLLVLGKCGRRLWHYGVGCVRKV